MDKAYSPSTEPEIYDLWEKSGAFTPKIDKTKKPFTIILPPPNANDPLHAGHALYTVEDIMVRFHRMLGDPTLWLPGTDHAGIETQFVFEKHLKADDKSRFDYDRNTLFKMISDFVNENRTTAVNQMKRLGFSLDWTRLKFAMDPDHNDRVFAVFRKMYQDGLIYRDEKIVNYCTRCGTAFSNLEVNHVEEIGSLYYMKYGPFVLATTRPETKFGDTAVAVNPKDKRYQQYVGQEITVDGLNGPFKVKVIADSMVDMQFGTGVVKITPAHDPDDFAASQRHHLEIKKIIGFDGRLNELTGKYAGLTVNQARQQVVADMQARGMLVKIDDHYLHRIGRCYRCNQIIEPMVSPQWYVKIESLADKAVEAVKSDAVEIFPKRFKIQFLTWMKDIRDWPISRQIVWGQRIPAWYNLDETPAIRLTFIDQDNKTIIDNWENIKGKYSFEIIKLGLQSLIAPTTAKYYLSEADALKSGGNILQETDTFDTWFSSGQWPYSTLGWDPDGHHSEDFKYFYPTSVLDTMWDILFFWVARMIMMGLYVTGEVPFKVAHMHSRVLDGKGQKMSKSKGNTINPVDIAENFGADALRLALVIGVAPGSDIALSEDKIRSARNFVNKIWNASRFVLMIAEKHNCFDIKIDLDKIKPADQKIIKQKIILIKQVTKLIEQYKFGLASEKLYQFFWHDFCDVYIESTKDRGPEVVPILLDVLITSLKLLHPFIPFVTESVYQQLRNQFDLPEPLLISSSWPDEIKIS
ncbi:MAG: valine--tRNA ligase [Candidatus Shapirobacteria bacterium]|jgi:valyl-tRNA synthetase